MPAPVAPRLRPVPAPRASRSRVAGLLALVLLVAGLLAPAAYAQIVKEKPGRIRAANRRALREARTTESPYKDSHLDVTSDRLKRGDSNEPRPATNRALDYKTGTAPNVQPPGLLGIRRKKAIQSSQNQKAKKEKKK
jgi:hypothetical protein